MTVIEKIQKILDECIPTYYEPSDSMELYHSETDTWYTIRGETLRDPSQYDDNSEGYTPFGDE